MHAEEFEMKNKLHYYSLAYVNYLVISFKNNQSTQIASK